MILGDAFLRNYHVVFDNTLSQAGFAALSSCPAPNQDQDMFPQTTALNAQIPSSPTNQQGGSNMNMEKIGIIVGVVVGFVIFVAVIIAIVFLVRRHRDYSFNSSTIPMQSTSAPSQYG